MLNFWNAFSKYFCTYLVPDVIQNRGNSSHVCDNRDLELHLMKSQIAQVHDFEHLEGRFVAALASSSKEGTETLVKDALSALKLTAAELAAELDVSPATVGRWLSGTTPHPRELRRMHELVRQRFSRPTEPEGVMFQNRALGIWGFDVFFKRAHGAKRVYCLKNLMGYQAGINYAVQDQLKQLFADNPDLQICYSFLKDSEAAATFKNFRAEIAREFAPNVKWKELPADHKLMQMLGEVFASPFIIEYPDDRVEVLLEVPLKVLRTSD